MPLLLAEIIPRIQSGYMHMTIPHWGDLFDGQARL